ncbi:MAG: hypothetical protein C0597_10585 [Marinilabiliales bacterium]|nr:MAG: hypothetical protein C0597_10585 [Marinilabiliales bacterium]
MKKITIALGVLIVLATVWEIVKYNKNNPLESINQASSYLSNAKSRNASKYSAELYAKASEYFDSSILIWHEENKKFFFFRKYDKVKMYAENSLFYSKESIIKSTENVSKLNNDINYRISKISLQLVELKKYNNHFPFNEKRTHDLTRSDLKFNELIILYKQSKFLLVSEKLDTIETDLALIEAHFQYLIEDYFKDYSKWKSMVDKTIFESKKNSSYCIIVDKFHRECLVYRSGLLQNIYKAELGSNWIGDKNFQGDKSTPEGIYKIITKKSEGSTKYYKALLINYPNEDDKKRFLHLKKNGIIKPTANIGNLIEIHGHGGKGIDWTDGCVALHNDDMDELYRISKTGMKVTIVGSAKPLKSINVI